MEDFKNLPKHIQIQLIEYAELIVSRYKKGIKKSKMDPCLKFGWENGL